MPGELETEKPQSEAPAEPEKAAATPAASKSVVGIIYPPPEVRNIVDKTADFVARNGLDFEDRIRINEAGNTKFNFLKPNDPYHAYYRHKITEIQEGVAQEAAAAAAAKQAQAVPKQIPLTVVSEPEPPKEPPPEFEFIAEPPSISSMELDIVKLTAQFVARNGAHFLDKLMVREQRNYQFDFLRKQHPLFTYFTKLVEQYSKILMPPHTRLHQLRREIENPYLVLDRVQQRVEWTQYQERQRRKEEEIEEKERVEYSQVDWHEFVLVETITFRESETGYLPPPIRPSQLAQRLLQQQKYERVADEGEVEEIEMEVEETPDIVEDKEERPASPPPKPPSPPPPPPSQPASVQIRRDYNPKSAAPPAPVSVSKQYLVSPITGEKIPANKIEEHMRYGLLDPRWIENQRRQMQEKKNEEAYSEGVQVQASLKNLAERRTDIFGVEETLIGQKIGEEKRNRAKHAVQWDGHSATAESVSRAAQSHITAAQIEAHQKSQGLIPDPEMDRIGPSTTTSSSPHLPLPTPRSQAHQIQSPPVRPPHSMQQHHHQQRGPPMSQQWMEAPQTRPLFSSAPSMPPSQAGRMPPPQPGLRPQQPGQRPPMPQNMTPQRPPMLPRPGMAPRPLLQMAPGMSPVGGLQAFPPVNIAPDINTDLGPPMAKRVHSEADDLIPEQQFLIDHPGPVTFRVHVPNIPDRLEWKMNGQLITMTLPITDPVSVIKAKISTEFGMPSGKQKLQIGNIFIKDSNSLAFYNITSSSVVQLGLKERGGRKR